MTIARQAARGAAKKIQPKLIDVSGMTVYPPPDKNGKKHMNFIAPKGIYSDA